jgi:hypothetical protein
MHILLFILACFATTANAAERPNLAFGTSYLSETNPKFDTSLALLFNRDTVWVKDEATYNELRWTSEPVSAKEFRIKLGGVVRIVDDGVEKDSLTTSPLSGKAMIYSKEGHTLRDDAAGGRFYKLTPKYQAHWPSPIDAAERLCRQKAADAGIVVARVNNPDAKQTLVKFLSRKDKTKASFMVNASFDDKTKGYQVETEFSEANGGWCQVLSVRLVSVPL